MDSAHRQSTKWFELRAVNTVGQLWPGQGRTAEANERLATTYGWFIEGFETVDLMEAKRLLGERS